MCLVVTDTKPGKVDRARIFTPSLEKLVSLVFVHKSKVSEIRLPEFIIRFTTY